MTDESYELFRQAVVDRDTFAWAMLAGRYRSLMIAWARRCQAARATHESCEDLADRAFARAWAALSPERFADFPSTAALLAYLRTCVTATAIDSARAQAAYERATSSLAANDTPSPEQIALEQLGRDELWELISRLVSSEAERVVVVERFVFDLPPRTIHSRHPALFADVPAVYASLRNVRERLRRNADLQQLYAEHCA
jgi:DNA-directed RNA polymerase specialized sigma24 family protein